MQKKLYPHKRKKASGNCPSCGFHISYPHSFESMLAGEFKNDHDGAYTAWRSTPVRASTMESEFLVPLAQSLVWSVVTVLPAIPLAYWLRYEWYFSLAAGSVALLISWLSAQRKTENSLSTIEEFSYTPSELDPAEISGTPGLPTIALDITDRTERNTISMQFVSLPPSIGTEKFREFSQGVVDGTSLARRNWTPESKLFSRDQFDELIAELVSVGIVASADGKARTLTRGGKHSLERYNWEVKNAGEPV